MTGVLTLPDCACLARGSRHLPLDSHRLCGGGGDPEFQSEDGHVRDWRQTLPGAERQTGAGEGTGKSPIKKEDLELIVRDGELTGSSRAQLEGTHGNMVDALIALTN